MKKIIFLFFLISLQSCSKPKTVLICGDHVCVNKAESRQYFEDNLSIEVKIIDKKKKKNFDLVELNLNDNSINKRKISIIQKKETNKIVKVLTNAEIKKIKKNIKNKDKEMNELIVRKLKKKNRQKIKQKKEINNNKRTFKVVDVCTIIEKCSIDDISKFLIQEGEKKDFPDITIKE
jgi:hypothetical protein